MKVCSKCKRELDESEFHKNKSKRGGLAGCCKSCQKGYTQKWYLVNSEKSREAALVRYYANSEKIADRRRNQYHANPEKYKERVRKWSQANPEKRREMLRNQYHANPEKARERRRKWRQANPEKHREACRRWAQANPERVREIRRRWEQGNPEKRNETLKNQIESLKDNYVAKSLGLHVSECLKELLETKRQILKIKRLCKAMSN